MKIIETRELQLMKLDALKLIDKICRKENIKYFLSAGTLLGAVREKGFIGWDEDIDIIMLREDFDKFNKVANKYLGERYFLQNYETEKYFIPPIARVCINGTYRCSKGYRNLTFHKGTFTDIFPIDKLFGDDKKRYHQYKKIMFLNKAMIFKLQKPESRTKLKLVAKYIIKGFLSLIPIDYFKSNMMKAIYESKDCDSKYIGSMTYGYGLEKETMLDDWFKETVYLEFEGILFPCPKEYDAYLSKLYGDYMTPPEVKDRKIDEPSYYMIGAH